MGDRSSSLPTPSSREASHLSTHFPLISPHRSPPPPFLCYALTARGRPSPSLILTGRVFYSSFFSPPPPSAQSPTCEEDGTKGSRPTDTSESPPLPSISICAPLSLHHPTWST